MYISVIEQLSPEMSDHDAAPLGFQQVIRG
jgi:hypothetical protein